MTSCDKLAGREPGSVWFGVRGIVAWR